jgi:4-amino-4-deoxy-L-arabinose transferase-like glycosyltransferase
VAAEGATIDAPHGPAAPARGRQARTLALLAVGLVSWIWVEARAAALHGHGLGPVRWILIGAAAALAMVPGVRRGVATATERIRAPSQWAVERAALGVALASTCYFVFTAFLQDRDLFPKTHDEGSYVIGLRMLARGKLWMPQHPLADFFDTFYVIVKPVYASLYFPGTALLYAPTDWLDWPTWVMPVLAAGAVAGLLYRIVLELVDGAAAALAVLLLLSLNWYRMLSVLVFSQVPLLLMALLLLWAWLHWRRDGKPGWALAMGAFAGWAAIIRPVDALCYALPVGAAVLWDLRKRTSRRLLTPAFIVAGALPFLSLQLYFNKGVTGSVAETPYTFYLKRDQPNTAFGFHPYDPSLKPQSTLTQKHEYYASFMADSIRKHQPGTFLKTWLMDSLPMLVDSTLPARPLVVLVPVGLLGLTDRRRRVVWASLPLFAAGYALNTFFLEHYAAAVIPAMVLSVLLGLRAVADAWPRWREHVMTAGTMVLVVATLTSLYEFNPIAVALDSKETRHLHLTDDETFHSPLLRFARDAELRVEKPAVILFRYGPGANLIEEPVYNTGVAYPDEAAVIRAHDLGPRNVEIFDYYAARDPRRMFYLFDRPSATLTPLGTAGDLSARSHGRQP